MLKQRRARNHISQLTLSNGEICSDTPTLIKEILEHFRRFFGTSNVRVDCIDSSVFEKKILSNEARKLLCREVTGQEIREALWSIKEDKCPGPDGFKSTFFKRAWNIVGPDIIAAIKEYFSTGCMLKQANSTSITLVPKVPSPISLNDYRPISCCSVLYKIISKVLSSRLRCILNEIVHLNQSAFIPGRKIADNVLLAHELVRGYHRNKGGCCALKVDIQKAYDYLLGFC